MTRIEDWLTHIDNEEDKDYLTRKLHDVNIRLMKVNHDYRHIVELACQMLEYVALSKMDGYKLPHGCSGANLGIPWNIIAVVKNRGTLRAEAEIMINPKIQEFFGLEVVAKSNCGSIRLGEPISVKRREGCRVTYYNLNGQIYSKVFHLEDGAFTVQHEVDHNNGILITDRQVKLKELEHERI